MKDRRKEDRRPRRIQLQFWDRDAPEDRRTGFTSDASLSGVFVESNRPLRSGTRIQMEFDRSPGSFLAEGLIVRSITVPPDLRKLRAGGMGVRILGIDALLRELDAQDLRRSKATPATPELGDDEESAGAGEDSTTAAEPAAVQTRVERPKRRTVFERETPSGDAARQHPAATRSPTDAPRDTAPEPERPSAVPTFSVAFRSFEELREAYERELQMGGLLVPTDTPAAVGTEIVVSLMLPLGRGRIEVAASVVQALPTGMGIVVEDGEGLAADLREILESE